MLVSQEETVYVFSGEGFFSLSMLICWKTCSAANRNNEHGIDDSAIWWGTKEWRLIVQIVLRYYQVTL